MSTSYWERSQEAWRVDTSGLGATIQSELKRLGLEQTDLVDASGLHKNTVSNYVTGKTWNDKQLGFLKGVSKISPAIERAVIEALDLDVSGLDDEERTVRDLVRAALDHRDNQFVRAALRNLEDVLTGVKRGPPRERGSASA